MFYDASKRTMISTEMKEINDNRFDGKINLETYRKDQIELVELFKKLLQDRGLSDNLEIDPTTIATDIQNRHVGKDFAVHKALSWLSAKGLNITKFIAVGDSYSDLAMAKELHDNGQHVEFVFVGNDNDREKIESAGHSFPIYYTHQKFNRGTAEFLNKE